MHFRNPPKNTRKSALALSLWAVLSSSATYAIDTKQAVNIKIPAGSLSDSLIDLADQVGVSIVFAQSPVFDKPVPAVKGNLSLHQLLQRLLQDSGLQAVYVSDYVISVVTIDGQKNVDDGAYVQNWLGAPWHEQLTVSGQPLTGSRLKRNDSIGSTPIDILSDFEIELAGAQSVGDLLRTLPSVVGNSASTSVSNGGDGTATVTLRGLPASSTLLLIDGRRVANAGLAGESVDLNSMSLAGIERVEVLKGGASAVYGSDAIAGVINVITKKSFDGLQIESYFGQSKFDDLQTRSTNILFGKEFENAQLTISAANYDQGEVLSRERFISANADSRALGGLDQRSSATPNVRIDKLSGDVILGENAQGSFLPGTSVDHFRPVSEYDGFNYQAHTTAIVPSSRKALNLAFQIDLTPDLGSYIDLAYTENSAQNRLAPVPLFLAFERVPLSVSANQLYNPFGEELYDVRKRLLEFGDRVQNNSSRSKRIAWGIEGGSDKVSWDIEWHWSRSDASESYTNVVNGDRLRQALGSQQQCINECVALNLFGPTGAIGSDQLDYLRYQLQFDGFSKLYGVSGNVNFRLGRADMAVGVDWRSEQMAFAPRQPFITPIGAPNRGPSAGERKVAEIYWEASFPLLAKRFAVYSLDLELASRFSHYSDFGETTNPRIALKYRPVESVMLRAMYAEGFRAPSLIELYETAVEDQAFLTDPCADPNNYMLLPGCDGLADDSRVQFLTIRGGEPSLEPERSKNITLGMVFASKHWPAFSASIDYYRIAQRNVVDDNAQYILDQNALHGGFAGRVLRDDNGDILSIRANKINIGTRRVEGWDVTANYAFAKTPKGQVFLSLNASNINRYSEQQNPAGVSVNLAGSFADAASGGRGALPKWKMNAGAYWKYKRWDASYTAHYISQLRENFPYTQSQRSIDAWLTHDIQANYVLFWGEGLRLTLGIDNVMGKEPPLSTAAFNDNIDARTHNLIGRFFYFKFSQKF